MLALVAVFAFSAVLVSMASAETTLVALWLRNGVAIEANLASHTTGEILLEDNKAPIVGKVDVVCSAILVGTVGVNGGDLITEVLNLALEPISSTPLVGLALLCEAVAGCEKDSEASPIEVWPENLPWVTLLFLMEGTAGAILDLVLNAAYDVLCLVLGAMVEDLCEAADSEFGVINSPAAEAEEGAATPNANCTVGGAGAGINSVLGLTPITLVEEGELTVSSE